MGAKHQFIEVPIPKGYSPEEREAIGEAIVEHIRERTKNGKDKNGKALPAYSKSYRESLDFKNAGKSPGERNFTQSGDTLAALDVLEVDEDKVVIGWEEGSQENAIADGNIRGTYGSNEEGKGPKRDILGIKEVELKRKILPRFPLANRDDLDREIAEYVFAKRNSRRKDDDE